MTPAEVSWEGGELLIDDRDLLHPRELDPRVIDNLSLIGSGELVAIARVPDNVTALTSLSGGLKHTRLAFDSLDMVSTLSCEYVPDDQVAAIAATMDAHKYAAVKLPEDGPKHVWLGIFEFERWKDPDPNYKPLVEAHPRELPSIPGYTRFLCLKSVIPEGPTPRPGPRAWYLFGWNKIDPTRPRVGELHLAATITVAAPAPTPPATIDAVVAATPNSSTRRNMSKLNSVRTAQPLLTCDIAIDLVNDTYTAADGTVKPLNLGTDSKGTALVTLPRGSRILGGSVFTSQAVVDTATKVAVRLFDPLSNTSYFNADDVKSAGNRPMAGNDLVQNGQPVQISVTGQKITAGKLLVNIQFMIAGRADYVM